MFYIEIEITSSGWERLMEWGSSMTIEVKGENGVACREREREREREI